MYKTNIKRLWKVEKRKLANWLQDTRNDMVVSSMGFLFSPLYSRLEAEEAGNPETPTGVDPKRSPKAYSLKPKDHK